jgi:hypothetical protein
MTEQFRIIGTAALVTILEEQLYEPTAQTAYRATEDYSLERWIGRPRNLCCQNQTLAPEVLYSVSLPRPGKKKRKTKDLIRQLNPDQTPADLEVVEILKSVIPLEIWAFCLHDQPKLINFRLALYEGLKGWVGAAVSRPSPLIIKPLATRSRKALPPDFSMVLDLLTADSKRVQPELMRELIQQYSV